MEKLAVRNRVRELRRRLKLRQADLAAEVDVTRQTIIAIEKNKLNPSILICLKIARVLREPLDYVFYLDRAPEMAAEESSAQEAAPAFTPVYAASARAAAPEPAPAPASGPQAAPEQNASRVSPETRPEPAAVDSLTSDGIHIDHTDTTPEPPGDSFAVQPSGGPEDVLAPEGPLSEDVPAAPGSDFIFADSGYDAPDTFVVEEPHSYGEPSGHDLEEDVPELDEPPHSFDEPGLPSEPHEPVPIRSSASVETSAEGEEAEDHSLSDEKTNQTVWDF